MPGYDATFGEVLLAPKGTPAAILRQWQEELARAFSDPQIRERMLANDLAPIINSPAEAQKRIRAQSEHWARVVNQVQLKVD